MSFRDLDLDTHYDSGKNDLLNEFYIPVLSEASEYYRAVGFFNSKSLSLVARGLKKFILNKGKMKLICGADLSPQDVKSIMVAEKTPEEIITKNFFENLDNLENYIERHHIQVLGWMVANNLLEIKIAIKLDDFGNPLPDYEGIFHYKLGILKDFDGNYITFSGSNNESNAAWSKNFEHFDVFGSWNKGDYSHLLNHIELFNNTWNESYNNEYSIFSIPEAVERQLIKSAPQDFNQLKFHEDIDIDDETEITLFDYQIEARDNWIENGRKGIFAMATGTGKTYTALGCLKDTLSSEEKLITIISVPYQHLVQQWKRSLEKFGIMKVIDKLIIADGTNPKKYQQIEEILLDIDLDYLNHAVIIAVHKTFANPKFINLFNQDIDAKFFLIGDEMHGLGSTTRRRGLLEKYDYRLGLSATPERFFDDYGTEFLFDYFGKEVYGFSLEKAINEINPMTDMTYLTPYNYHLSPVELTYDELKKYDELSWVIAIESSKENPNQKTIEKKLIERANLIKNAKNKYDVLREILSSMKDKSNLLIFCSEKQLDKVLDIAGNEFDMDITTFTSADKSNPIKSKGNKSERDIILEDFTNGDYDGLVSMHCLDEGVDIPSASKAILMCNSTNPREFIQRVGRVIRRSKNKSFADVYDMIIKPSKNSEFKETENDIFEKEKRRTDMIGSCAINKADYYIKLYE